MCELTSLMIIGYLLVGYLLGSIPFGLIFGKISGHGDIRAQGSGNIGSTNMLRVAGKKWALLTLLADGVKGAVPVILASSVCLQFGAVALLGAVLGHMFSILLKFKGGKGVATTIGGLIALSPIIGAVVCLVWLATAFLTRYSSLSALIAVLVAPVLVFFLIDDINNIVLFVVSFIAMLVWLKHHENIKRLLKGEESKIGRKKS